MSRLTADQLAVEAVVAWRVVERTPERWRELGQSLSAVGRAVDSYLTAPRTPAVGPEPRYGDGTGGMVCKLCGLDWPDERETLEPHVCPSGFVKVASAVRALPDEQPLPGMIDHIISRHLPKLAEAERQAEVRRCEQAVCEAVASWRNGSTSLDEVDAVDAALDALLAAREKAGGE